MTEIEDEEAANGTILQEIQAGYMLGERLLRPALVGVSKNKNQKIKENEEKKKKIDLVEKKEHPYTFLEGILINE